MCIYIEQVDFVLRSLDTRSTALDQNIAVSLIANIIKDAKKDEDMNAALEAEITSRSTMN
ncbi:hypothetical protein HQQ94_08305 [Shewanella sp. VB17]|uniref:hypothetical protein n=1 Tax=Shewanella sp. VB17 TaxID=2739432 RepID=UPI0015663119|nr:hypothetical protein [Shewanella sp. VB17]NRD73244.1 hypothetical protein [Shewanella sp. VB17]